MTTKYFRITPLERDKTYIVHNIVSKEGEERRWAATQIVGSQVGFRHFHNPIEQHEIDDLLIYSDPRLSGYQFDDGFDCIKGYDYSFDDSFSDEEQDLLIDLYEGGSGNGIGEAWLQMSNHNWRLEEDEVLLFECPVKIDLINQEGEVLEEDVQPI